MNYCKKAEDFNLNYLTLGSNSKCNSGKFIEENKLKKVTKAGKKNGASVRFCITVHFFFLID